MQFTGFGVPQQAFCNEKVAVVYGMIAYDENLECYAEKSMNEAAEEYEELIRGSEATVKDALCNLDAMIRYFKQLNVNLHSLLEVNDKIDNTNVN